MFYSTARQDCISFGIIYPCGSRVKSKNWLLALYPVPNNKEAVTAFGYKTGISELQCECGRRWRAPGMAVWKIRMEAWKKSHSCTAYCSLAIKQERHQSLQFHRKKKKKKVSTIVNVCRRHHQTKEAQERSTWDSTVKAKRMFLSEGATNYIRDWRVSVAVWSW